MLLLTDENKNSLSVQLSRRVDSDVVKRVVKAWYENPFNPPGPQEVAMVIRYPSYLSMEYVLSKNDILSQIVYTLTLVTTKKPYSYGDGEFEYHQVKKSLFFEYEKHDSVLITYSEKALLDLLYIRYVKTNELDTRALLSLADDMYLMDLDKGRLTDYLKRYPTKVQQILRRLDI